ncbi:MAG: TIM barrel protein [Chloroflexota bacterium]
MNKLLFGTGGTPHSAKTRSSVDGIRRIAELGLGCMELEFVQGVTMGEQTAREVAKVATSLDIKLSAHAPYYINLNAREPEKIKASQDRLVQTARIGAICGARSAVVHIAFYLGDSPEKAYASIKENLEAILSRLKKENNPVWIRPEVMGRATQFGTIEEILDLSTELTGVAPCVDFAHKHAREGKVNSYPEFAAVLEQIQKRLGRAALDDIHIHFSGIAYGSRGEIKHLDLKDSDLQYKELLKALKDYKVKGLVICESPNLEEDALLLQETYLALP